MGRILLVLACVAMALGAFLTAPATVFAATFGVNSPLDAVDANPGDGECLTAGGVCTLRAAVQEANALGGVHTIILPAGSFTLSIPGQGENAAATGDLDLSADITISGAGAQATIIQAGPTAGAGVDRVFDVRPAATVSISDVTIRHGTTNGGVFGVINGAALWNQGTTTLSDVWITANQASGSGGAIYNRGQLQVLGSTISANTTPGDSGAIQSEHVGGVTALTISNSTLSGNSAGASTGAILIVSPSELGSHTVNIYNSTIANHTAGGGAGAIAISDGAPVVTTVNLQNSIITGNSGNQCDGGPLPTGAGNRIDDASCGAAAGNLGAVSGLSSLAANGGPTPTHGLLPGSNALDQGVGGCADAIGPLATDQRGQPRPRGAACDLGPFEGVVRLVTSTADNGLGTLRQALDDANADLGFDVINFAILGAGVQTITPSTALPPISDPVFIDGYTQPASSPNTLNVGNDGVLLIELNGTTVGGNGLLLGAGSSGSTMQGLVINRFGDGVRVLDSDNHTLTGNFLGTNAAGTAALGSQSHGIVIENSNGTLIGGPTAAARNVIAGNNLTGIFAQAGTTNLTIAGNYIGTNAAGTAALSNGSTFTLSGGIYVNPGAGTVVGTLIANNLISGNIGDGISLWEGGVSGTIIQGNRIGVAADGVTALGNNLVDNEGDGGGIALRNLVGATIIGGADAGEGNLIANNGGDAGVVIYSGSGHTLRGNTISNNAEAGILLNASNNTVAGNNIFANGGEGLFILGGANNTIGGTAAGAGNVITSNGLEGVRIVGAGADDNLVQGNRIGLDGDDNPAGNSTGLFIGFDATGNTIGGTSAAERNIVSGNSFDGVLTNAASNNTIVGNYIGTASDGVTPVPNTWSGVRLFNSSGNTVGGTTANEGNLIANNLRDGVRLESGSANRLLSNRIFANSGQQVALNDGANGGAVAPTITTAVPSFPVAGQSNVQGWLLSGTPSSDYSVQLFGSTGCAAGGAAEARTLLDSFTLTTDAAGIGSFTRDLSLSLVTGSFVSAIATDSAGNSSALAPCAPAGPDNTAWYAALPLSAGNPSASQPLALAEQVRWYYIEVEPRSRLVVNLGNLPAGYDMALFNDLNARAEALIAAASDDPAAALSIAQVELDYDFIESSNFVTNTLAPELYSPEAYSAAALSSNNFRSTVLAETVVSPFKLSPFKLSPFKLSPFKLSPFKLSPFKLSPFKLSPFKLSDLAGTVVDSGLLSYTDVEGTQPRTLTLTSYNERGRIYIAVYGRNGAFDPVQPFTLTAAASDSVCANLSPPAPSINGLSAQAGNFTTLFLTDLDRLPGSAAERNTLLQRITTLGARPEVGGVLVNLADDARVVAANATASASLSCPEAKNLVANEVKRLIDAYRELNPNLRYIVLVGGDEVIPYYRYPDQALLGNESEFQPPVRNESSAEATLRLGYILGQDEYGARYTLNFRSTRLAIPELAVGRLVETASEATTMIERYLDSDGLITPESSFVSGYDFHYDSASLIANELAAGTARPVDRLLSPSTESYQEPGTWTASDLREALVARDYDLLYLAGHFSDGALKAADYATVLRAAELESAELSRLAGALVVSPGCHSGYNTPDGAAILGATDQPDWAQFFARRGTTLVAGTGYQYGDTQFIQFAEELYTRFFEQLRIDSDPSSSVGDEVVIGDALVLAKQRYLLDSAVIRGIDKKTLTISTLFGLPMTRVDMQGARLAPLPPPALPDVLGPLSPLGTPDDDYSLQSANITLTPDLTVETLNLSLLDSLLSGNEVVTPATYVRGATTTDLIARPGEPVLPFAQYRVGRDVQQLRGALFLGGGYSELTNVLPLTGAPATELRGVHITFPTEAFYPEQWWSLNTLGELTGVSGDDRVRLQLTPAQFLADPGSIRGTLRYYDGPLNFRLFYSDQTAPDASGFNPALAGAPAIPVVSFSRDGALVNFVVSAHGGGVPLREVWVTFTAASGPLAGQWQSIQLTASADDPTRYTGSYSLPGNTEEFAFFVQAANAVGFTTLNTNLGLYYQVGGFVNNTVVAPPPAPVSPPAANALATSLSITLPSGATFGQVASFSVQLSAGGAADLSGQALTFNVGGQTASATTNASGSASFTLNLLSTGDQPIAASFGGSANLLPSSVTTSLSVARQQPSLSASVSPDQPLTVTATLNDSNGGIRDARLYLSVGGAVVSARTGPTGAASLVVPDLVPGSYPFTVSYLLVPTADGLESESDARYLPATTTGTLTIQTGATLETTITAGPSGMISDTVVRFSFTGSGSVAVIGFECQLSRDGAPADFVPCSSPMMYKGLANGSYEFSVRALGAGGLVDPTPATQSVSILSLYRAVQQGQRVLIERNVAAAALGDWDPDGDGWALVGRTNGAADNGELRAFFVEDGIPYAVIFNRNNHKGNRCILVVPQRLDQVRKGQTRLVFNLQDPTPCLAETPATQLP